MKKWFIAAFALLAAIVVSAQEQSADATLVIKAQGSFLASGTVVKTDGAYDTKDQTNPQGQQSFPLCREEQCGTGGFVAEMVGEEFTFAQLVNIPI